MAGKGKPLKGVGTAGLILVILKKVVKVVLKRGNKNVE